MPLAPTASGRRALFACLFLVTALGALDQTIVATALPAIVAELGAPSRASWVVTAYALALTAAMPAAGALGDRFGHRRVLTLSIAVFVAASAACGFAGDVAFLAAARLAQGLGGAGLLVLPQAVVAGAVPARERAAFLGPLGAVYAIATVAGPLLGGWLTDVTSWRWVFWLNLPLGAAAVVLVRAAVPADRGLAGRGRFDTLGAVLLATAATGLVLVTTTAAETGWNAVTTTAAALTAVTGAVALGWERRAANPVLPVALLRDRTVRLSCVLALTGGIGLFGVLAYVPTWVQEVYRRLGDHVGAPAAAGHRRDRRRGQHLRVRGAPLGRVAPLPRRGVRVVRRRGRGTGVGRRGAAARGRGPARAAGPGHRAVHADRRRGGAGRGRRPAGRSGHGRTGLRPGDRGDRRRGRARRPGRPGGGRVLRAGVRDRRGVLRGRARLRTGPPRPKTRIRIIIMIHWCTRPSGVDRR
ncbi:MFS transporter [Amycolatopsis deserti]|uniref:MFS transporter n=1 Tax=Amycolatopsis deserti TaxID=185696 RepID=UPI00174D7FBB|nr:MFS transporter [Amycolatopsis deserti]